MPRALLTELCPQRALIFRIVHRDNLPWLLDNGLHCPSSRTANPSYVSIGNPDLIDKRQGKAVPISPHGMLSDYVPFYFTPFSIMLLNIKTGRHGLTRRSSSEIVILVSSVHELNRRNIPFIFTDGHAYAKESSFWSDISRLDMIDWNILQRRDFTRDNEDIGKTTRYQAEALIHKFLPVDALRGIVCHDETEASNAQSLLTQRNLELKVIAKPGWYF